MDLPQPSFTRGSRTYNIHSNARTHRQWHMYWCSTKRTNVFSYIMHMEIVYMYNGKVTCVCMCMPVRAFWLNAVKSEQYWNERSCQVVVFFFLLYLYSEAIFQNIVFFHLTAPWNICLAVHITQSCWLSACFPTPICVYVFTGTCSETVFAIIKY